MEETILGKSANIPSGWNWEGGEVTVTKDNNKGVLPSVTVKYKDGTEVEFDKQFIRRHII